MVAFVELNTCLIHFDVLVLQMHLVLYNPVVNEMLIVDHQDSSIINLHSEGV